MPNAPPPTGLGRGVLNRETLDAIRARVDKATPGPWRAVTSRGTGAVAAPDSVGCYVYVNVRTHDDMTAETVSRWQDDARFVAAARTDVPALLDEVERLTASEKEREQKEFAHWDAFTAQPCTRCGGKRNWQLDGYAQAVCYSCGHPELSSSPQPGRAAVGDDEIENAYTVIAAAHDLYRKSVPVSDACHADVLGAAMVLMRAAEANRSTSRAAVGGVERSSTVTEEQIERGAQALCEYMRGPNARLDWENTEVFTIAARRILDRALGAEVPRV